MTSVNYTSHSPLLQSWLKVAAPVQPDCVMSTFLRAVGGIPQGSALGPLLFLIYVNDLPSQVTGGLLLQYADNTTIICSAPTKDDVASLMNSQLKLIDQWTSANKMTVNYSKSSVMWFRVSNRRLPHG